VILQRSLPQHRLVFVQLNCDDHKWAIPPHTNGYEVSTTVDPCKVLQQDGRSGDLSGAGEGMEVFELVSHTHASGVGVRLERVGGKPSLLWQGKPNTHQRIESGRAQVICGEGLRVTCTYNNRGSRELRHGFHPTKDEMCIVYLSAGVKPFTELTLTQSPQSPGG